IERMADGRLAQPQPAAGAGGAALLHQCLEHPQQVQVEMVEVNRLNRLHICRTPVGLLFQARPWRKSNATSHFPAPMIPVHLLRCKSSFASCDALDQTYFPEVGPLIATL